MEQFLAALAQKLFYIFAMMAIGGATFMVFAKTAIHSVIGFLLAMLSVAGCFLSLDAEFLGMAQILVYAGGIVVLFLFVVMLVEMSKYKEKGLFQVQAKLAVPAVLAAVAAFAGVFSKQIFGPPAAEPLVLTPGLVAAGEKLGNAQMVSRGVFAGYLLPFEILSVVLLVALVAAVVLAKSERV